MSLVARMNAARKLDKITDAQFEEARMRHLASWDIYRRGAEQRQQEAGPQLSHLFEDISPNSQVPNAVGTLLLLLGLFLAEQPSDDQGRAR